jgi:hemerythrin
MDWEPSLSVGNPEIDRQHMRLLALGRQAAELLEREQFSSELFHMLLNDITDAAFQHFAEEEELLARNHCPTLQAHKAEHEKYLEQLTRVLYAGAIGEMDRAGLAQVLRDWMAHHLRATDLPAKAYMRR